jgi:hypothetical protein
MPSSTLLFAATAMALACMFLKRRATLSLGLAPTLLTLLLILHGPAYLYYTRIWGPERAFFQRILTAASPGSDVIASLDIAIAIMFLGVCAGIALADLVLGCCPLTMRTALRSWDRNAMEIPAFAPRRALLLGMCGAAFLTITAVTNNHLGRVLQFFYSQGDEFEKIELRRDLCAGDTYLFLLLNSTVLPFSACALLALARSGCHSARLGVLTIVPCLFVAKLATLSKSPIVVFCLLLALTEIARRTLRPRLRTMVPVAIGGISLILVMSFVAIRTLANLEEALNFIVYRMFMVVNEVLLEYFAAIPSRLPHAWGANSGWLSVLLGIDPPPALYWLVGEVHRDVRASTSNAMFLGDAWGGFSWLGVLVTPIVAGFVTRGIDIELIVRRGKSAGAVAGLVLGQYGVVIAMTTAFQTALITGGLLLVLPLASWLGARRRRSPAVAGTPLPMHN